MASRLLTLSDTYRQELETRIEEYYNNNSITVDQNGCHIWQLGLSSRIRRMSSQYGLMNVKIESKFHDKRSCRIKPGAHVVVYFLKTNQVPEKGVFDISHLCHNSICVNYQHLNREPHFINMDRYTSECKTKKRCTGHVDLCNEKVYPQCIIN